MGRDGCCSIFRAFMAEVQASTSTGNLAGCAYVATSVDLGWNWRGKRPLNLEPQTLNLTTTTFTFIYAHLNLESQTVHILQIRHSSHQIPSSLSKSRHQSWLLGPCFTTYELEHSQRPPGRDCEQSSARIHTNNYHVSKLQQHGLLEI